MKNCVSGKQTKLVAIVLLALISIYSCNNDNEITVDQNRKTEEKVVTANRVGSSITFIDAVTNTVTKTLTILNSDPMYVVYVPKTDKLYVGDRANKKIHVINPQNQQIETSVDVGNGVFHLWADAQGKELWVVNDIDKTISVVNLATNSVTNTISVDMTPHDIFLSQDGTTAYISVFTSSSTSDKIYKYSTSTYTKTGEKTVGKEPHLFYANNKLYVPCQLEKTYILDGNTLNTLSEKVFTGAHGIFTLPSQNIFFVSNITGNQLYSINATTGDQIGSPVPSSAATPHNIVLNDKGDKMFVTHYGGTANTVSIYNVSSSGVISPSATATVGTNPFGLTYYKRELK